MKKKKVAVLFSGGLDSTYLVRENLLKENIVTPIYIEIENNYEKVIIEKQQSQLIHQELLKEFSKELLMPIEYPVIVSVARTFNSLVSFPQPLIWVLSLPFSLKGNHEIQFGYVGGDDIIGHLDEVKKLYKATQPFAEELPVIKFPLIKNHKQWMMEELPEQYQKLIVSCEAPVLSKIKIRMGEEVYHPFEPCGSCIPCKKIINNNCFGSKILRERYINPTFELRKRDYTLAKEMKNHYENSTKEDKWKEENLVSTDLQSKAEIDNLANSLIENN